MHEIGIKDATFGRKTAHKVHSAGDRFPTFISLLVARITIYPALSATERHRSQGPKWLGSDFSLNGKTLQQNQRQLFLTPAAYAISDFKNVANVLKISFSRLLRYPGEHETRIDLTPGHACRLSP